MFLAIVLSLAAGAIFFLIAAILWALWLQRGFPSLSEKDAGTFANYFIYINEDGTARELTPDERSYLNTEFHPVDGNRPYIKYNYDQISPDGKISGFLLKRRLPRRMPVAKNAD